MQQIIYHRAPVVSLDDATMKINETMFNQMKKDINKMIYPKMNSQVDGFMDELRNINAIIRKINHNFCNVCKKKQTHNVISIKEPEPEPEQQEDDEEEEYETIKRVVKKEVKEQASGGIFSYMLGSSSNKPPQPSKPIEIPKQGKKKNRTRK
jgi:hypothetical protein